MKISKSIFIGAVSALILVGCSSSTSTEASGGDEVYNKVPFAGAKATAKEQASCEGVGGRVVADGLAGHEICEQDLPDAGEVCKDKADCIGDCIIPPQEGRAYTIGEPATGVCSATDNPFGCVARVEKGMATPELCVD